MTFPERFSNLPEHTWPRLRALLGRREAPGPTIDMTIGEPKHAFPDFVGSILAENLAGFSNYPPNNGSDDLLNAIARWVKRRYNVELDASRHIMALNGTREGLFNAAISLVPEVRSEGQRPVVLVPNPYYSVYAVAALAVGAEPVYVAASAENGFLPDYGALPAAVLDRVSVAYICSPSNPQGAVASADYLRALLNLAEKHDFRVFSDECYSEIYRDTPPAGLLEVARDIGADPERVLVFHSLSKRSNLPGLRSGFVAGGAECIAYIRQLRAYAGTPLPLPLQKVAEATWDDEAHVEANRAKYQTKFGIADEIFGSVPGYISPQAGFFLWLPVEHDEEAALKVWGETGVRILPGSYLGRDVYGGNPGDGYVRVAMVTNDIKEMQHGLIRLRDCLYN